MKIGTSYFGNRALVHASEDMKYLKELGFTHVFHTFSEEDILFQKEAMKNIVNASHEEGLSVYVGPWSVANVFGGQALSKFVTLNTDDWQIASDGHKYPTMCLNSDRLKDFMKNWIDDALYIGADVVFWDEPHWLMPDYYDLESDVWGCRCDNCKRLYFEMYSEEMPTEVTKDVDVFKRHYIKKFIFEISDYAKSKGLQVAVCLLPIINNKIDEMYWDEVASYPNIDIFATDPYWMLGDIGLDKHYDLGMEGLINYFSEIVLSLSKKYKKEGQIWIQNYGIKESREHEVEIAFKTAYNAGIRNIFSWSFKATQYMSRFCSDRPEIAWSYFVKAAQDVIK